jgi:hypothetical protein
MHLYRRGPTEVNMGNREIIELAKAAYKNWRKLMTR